MIDDNKINSLITLLDHIVETENIIDEDSKDSSTSFESYFEDLQKIYDGTFDIHTMSFLSIWEALILPPEINWYQL